MLHKGLETDDKGDYTRAAKKQGRSLLVTGTKSGLGNAVHAALGGVAVTRQTNLASVRPPDGEPYDAIIHCAVNTTKTVTLSTAYSYLEDNVLLTQELLRIPHRRFVYISSVDLYPRLDHPARPEDEADIAELSGLYTYSKLFSDVLVQKFANRPLVLRPTTLLGPVMRPNSTYRILTQPHCRLFLSARSRFNYVLHSDIVQLIDQALRADIAGTFNVASSTSVVLADVVGELGLSVEFGSYNYNVGSIDQTPASTLNPAFARPSWQTLNAFIEQLGPLFVGRGRLRGQ